MLILAYASLIGIETGFPMINLGGQLFIALLANKVISGGYGK